MEMPTKSGFAIDNLLVTPTGDLILVECKLWRNYESRRKVVVQILEYAKEIATWSYADLEAAIKRASYKHLLGDEAPKQTFYEFAKTSPDPLEEHEFIDQVSKALRRGRFLLLIVGDGIHEGLEDLVGFVQQHAGLHFTLGLIDIAIFQAPGGGLYVQPRVIARTMNIDRGIVSVKEGNVVFEPPAQRSEDLLKLGRRTTISEEKFYEALTQSDPELPAALRRFIERVSDLGIETDFGQSSLVLRWRAIGYDKWNFGSVHTSGRLYTDMIDYQARQFGRPELSHRYQETLCALIPGARIKKSKTTQSVAKASGLIEVQDLLENEKRQLGWIAAIEEFMDAVKAIDATE